MSGFFEEVAPNAIRIGDVVAMQDELTGVVTGIRSPIGHKRAERGELSFLLRVPRYVKATMEWSTEFSAAKVRRLTPVAADKWLQENLP